MPQPQCLAIPTCEPWEIESDDRCVEDEWGCRDVTVCGATITCREDPCEGAGAEGSNDSDGERSDEAADPIACP